MVSLSTAGQSSDNGTEKSEATEKINFRLYYYNKYIVKIIQGF